MAVAAQRHYRYAAMARGCFEQPCSSYQAPGLLLSTPDDMLFVLV